MNGRELNSKSVGKSSRQSSILMREIPFAQIRYIISEIVYGGRILDNKDNHLVAAIANKYFTPSIFEEGYKFSKSGLYYSPQSFSLKDYISYIESLPSKAAPEALGMHSNMSILQGEKEIENLARSLQSINEEFNLSKDS